VLFGDDADLITKPLSIQLADLVIELLEFSRTQHAWQVSETPTQMVVEGNTFSIQPTTEDLPDG
jgi:hypothetical protein